MPETTSSDPGRLGDLAVMGLDAHGVVRWISDDAAVLLGESAKDATGQPIESLFDFETGGRALSNLPTKGEAILALRGKPGDPGLLRARTVRLHGSDELLLLLAPPGTAPTHELQRARLMHMVADRVGMSLDLAATAQNLADLLVPDLGDMASVNLTEAILAGDEPSGHRSDTTGHLRRMAVAGAWQPGTGSVGRLIPEFWTTPAMEPMYSGRATSIASPSVIAAESPYPESVKDLVPEDAAAGLAAPLYARDLVLGSVTIWRTASSPPYTETDRRLLQDVAAHAAVAVDNARRHIREHATAVALQQRLLPPDATTTAAGETVGIYVPADSAGQIGGDWFDVIPLSSSRIGLVIGDVFGHGLTATATMARIRTAVQTLADLDLDPGEALTHADDLVQRLAAESEPDIVGATCLLAVYDPVTGELALASAGHPLPIVCTAQGECRELRNDPGPPLGVGGIPFTTTTTRLEPESVLTLYTDGLLRPPRRSDPLRESAVLARELQAALGSDRALRETGASVLRSLPARTATDDAALLLFRAHRVPESYIAEWTFPAEEQHVAHARAAVLEQLERWELPELGFSTELIVSELVTNAIRYAGGPVHLRLVRTDVLLCEVDDPSNTQPRMRRADFADEGGRGLFLIAQLSGRWGSRYRQQGKTIWTEQPLGGF